MSDTEDLLAVLHAHGQQFMDRFGDSVASSQKKKRKFSYSPDLEKDSSGNEEDSYHDSDDEWDGISVASTSSVHSITKTVDREASSSGPNSAPVVVFSGSSLVKGKQKDSSKVLKKQFMSSKVSKIREDISEVVQKDIISEDESGDEQSNAKNDALLHRLVHTRLLSGSLNEELDLSRGKRQRALQGRLLELSSGAKLGKGDTIVTREERSKANKRVRLGLERKTRERQAKALDEAKQLGNYHSSIKHVFEDTTLAPQQRKKRERGLRLGVGKFSGGTLKLSRQEIESVQGSRLPSMNGKARGRKKGGKTR